MNKAEIDRFSKLLLLDANFGDNRQAEHLQLINWHARQVDGVITPTLSTLLQGEYVGVVWSIDESSKFRKLISIFSSFYVCHKIKLTLKKYGFDICDRYGYFQSIDNTLLIFTLKSDAADYARRNLVGNVPKNKFQRVSYSIISFLFGLYPTLSGVLIIGKRDAQ